MVKEHLDSRRWDYSFRLTARVLLYLPSHRQDSTYHSLCYTSRGALAGTRNSSMGPPHEGSIRWPITPWANALTTELHLAPGFTMKHRSDDPLHYERTLLPQSYISLLGSPWRIDPMTHRTMSERSYHIATSLHQNVSHRQNTLTAQSGGITAKWTKAVTYLAIRFDQHLVVFT